MKSYISRKFPQETRTTRLNPVTRGILSTFHRRRMAMPVVRAVRRTVALAVCALLVAALACADDVRVITSGAFTAAYLQLVPEFERTSSHHLITSFGASMGPGPTTIPSRLERHEPLDVVILAAPALEDLVARR